MSGNTHKLYTIGMPNYTYKERVSMYIYHSVSYTVNTVYIAYHVQLCTSSLFDQSLHHCYFVLPSLHCTFPCNSNCALTLYVMNIQIKCLWYTCPCGLTLSTWWCRLKCTIVVMGFPNQTMSMCSAAVSELHMMMHGDQLDPAPLTLTLVCTHSNSLQYI